MIYFIRTREETIAISSIYVINLPYFFWIYSKSHWENVVNVVNNILRPLLYLSCPLATVVENKVNIKRVI